MTYRIRYTRSTNHIEGIAERTTGPLTDNTNTTGVVSYYATSACPSLSRSGHKMGVTGEPLDSLADALEAARVAGSRNLCKHCERAATRTLESTYDIAQRHARSAEAQREYSAGRSTEHVMEGHEARAERTYEAYRAAADALDRCLIFECENTTDPARAYCPEHTTSDDIEDDDPAVAAAGRASTQGKPYTPTSDTYTGCEARIYHDGVGSPCGRPRGHKGPGGTAHRTTTGIEWMPGQTRPLYCPYARTSKGCEDCADHAALVERIMGGEFGGAKSFADAEALAVAIEEEPEAFTPVPAADTANPNCSCSNGLCEDCAREYRQQLTDGQRAGRDAVVARLDHTEPGKAIVLITGGHGREHAPQAWLAHEGGSWLLVDDYDGDTLNVKGPDAERAVHAWAALLGLRIDTLTIEVEYAGGPVTPPVRTPERPVADTLAWAPVGDDDGAPVFEAHGHAHVYRVTEYASGYTPLVATLRGSNVMTHVRTYDHAPDARTAAEHYEARYGSAYVPAE